jgi:hypothetical protein
MIRLHSLVPEPETIETLDNSEISNIHGRGISGSIGAGFSLFFNDAKDAITKSRNDITFENSLGRAAVVGVTTGLVGLRFGGLQGAKLAD